MTPLPRWACPVCGVVLFALAEVEAHVNHTPPLKHVHAESYAEQPLLRFDLSSVAPSGTNYRLTLEGGSYRIS